MARAGSQVLLPAGCMQEGWVQPGVQWAAQAGFLQGGPRCVGHVVWTRSVLDASLYVYLTLQHRDDLRLLLGDLHRDITALMLPGCVYWMISNIFGPVDSEDET